MFLTIGIEGFDAEPPMEVSVSTLKSTLLTDPKTLQPKKKWVEPQRFETKMLESDVY